MKTKFNGILTLFIAFVVQISFAQQKTISGTVSDSSGSLPGVSVVIKGGTVGTETDFDGKYSIKASSGDILVFRYLGYKTVERTVGNSNSISIILKEDANVLDEIVVTGYGSTTKRSFTGTVKVVKAQELEKKNFANVTQALTGEIAGVNVINTSGQPGTVATVRIRGFGSVNGNRAPLYVVDGVPLSGTINAVNPSDIESTTVLKDATATAIYGSRGANGVILITTKSGKSGVSNIEVDFKTGVNFQNIGDYDVITDPDEYLELSWLALKNSKPTNSTLTDAEYANANLFGGASIDPNYNYYTTNDVSQIIDPTTGRVRSGATRRYTPENWRDFAFQSSIRTEANVKMSGGNDKTRYFSSFGYLDDVGFISNSSFERISTRLNVTHKPVDWITANSNIAYTYGETTQNGQGSSSNSVFWFVNSIPSIYPLFLRDTNGDFIDEPRYGGNVYDYGDTYSRGFGLGTNAIADAIYNLDQNKRYTFNGNFSVKLKLFEGLTFESKYGVMHFSRIDNNVNNPFYGALSTAQGRINQVKDSRLTQNLLNLFNYTKDFGNHNINLILAHETNQSDYETSTVSKEKVVNLANGLTSLDNYIIGPNPPSGFTTKRSLESYFGQANYGYDNKYYFTASLRRDGSSRFANNKWGTFGSVGASWVVSKESFMEKADFVNFLKVKASYGLIGDQAGVDLFSGQNTYSINNLGGEIALGVNAIQDPNLTWETSKILQFGTEFTLFNNTIDGAIDYYIKDTEDLIFDRRIGPSIGDALIRTNDGVLRNSGLEFDITAHLIKKENFSFDFSINGAFLDNELITMPIEPATGLPKILDQNGNYGRAGGRSIFDFYLREWAGVNPTNGNAMWNLYYHDANSNGNLDTGEEIASLTEYLNTNPNNAISQTTTETYSDATEKFIDKSAIPTVNGAFKLAAKIYDFDISTQFVYSLGGYSYDNRYAGLMSNSQVGNANYSVDIRNSWQNPGDITDVPKLQNGLNPQVNSASSRFVTSTDHLALNNFRVGYTVPQKFLGKVGLSSMNLWLSGDNLFLLSTRQGFDPRISQTGNNSVYNYSLLSTMTLGIRVKF
ncbi:SusC/RagA family TonB-linked outer membrane protein [Polaribacter porphyrae]|uniref:SusC/RagA family TonB-linked outer membrane protein n=1 Tax=Polaribacter porphyrae TaxID=1137780 RepID=A0A2S7WNN6_9FLAO|nr:SusC/RagA family TonB-linked outer membrane protein [Polaribacter porphyrae]PQJ79210.1 SusC/RagA family TonB-linked outer membrane protein [Polaribacter porphyrae]